MSSQDDEPEYRVVALVLISVIVLAVGLALGIGIHKSRGSAPAAAAVVAAPAAAAVAASSDDASVVVENGVVKFYFASGKADLAAGALDALGEAIASAKAGKKLVISGFHDATGDPAFNAELAKAVDGMKADGTLDIRQSLLEGASADYNNARINWVAAGVTADLTGRISAVTLVKAASAALGGKGGGGRPDMAQGGGEDIALAEAALKAVHAALEA